MMGMSLLCVILENICKCTPLWYLLIRDEAKDIAYREPSQRFPYLQIFSSRIGYSINLFLDNFFY